MTGGLLEGRSQVFMFSFSTAQSELDIPIWSPGWRHHTVHTSPITKYGFLTVSACSICQAPGSFSIESQRKWNISRPSLVQDNGSGLAAPLNGVKRSHGPLSSLLSPSSGLSQTQTQPASCHNWKLKVLMILITLFCSVLIINFDKVCVNKTNQN